MACSNAMPAMLNIFSQTYTACKDPEDQAREHRSPQKCCTFGRFFVSGDLDLWSLTPKFEHRQDFCTMHLSAKFHHPTFNRSEVIMLTNKLTNRRRWKHPPRSAMLRRWVNINNANNSIYGNDIMRHLRNASEHKKQCPVATASWDKPIDSYQNKYTYSGYHYQPHITCHSCR